MHPAPVRYAPGHPVDDATLAAFNPVAPIDEPQPGERPAADARRARLEMDERRRSPLTAIPNLSLHRREVTTQPMDCMVEPSFGLVVQGTKRLIQSGDGYLCDANRFLITSSTCPVRRRSSRPAAKGRFSESAKLDFRVMAELMAQVAAITTKPRQAAASSSAI